MEPAFPDRMPIDVLVVEDDPIIALDFEDIILRLGVKTVRTAPSVAKALEMIARRLPDFAWPSGWRRSGYPSVSSRDMALKFAFPRRLRTARGCPSRARPRRSRRC